MTVLKVSEHNPVVDANEGLIRVVLNLLDEAFDKKSWHGPNLRGSIRGVTAAQAAWRIAPDRHNIWELTLHAAYWKYVVRRRLSGGGASRSVACMPNLPAGAAVGCGSIGVARATTSPSSRGAD